jgi:hypothetical protein
VFLWHTRVSRDKKSVPLRGATVRRRRAFSAFAGPRRASTPVPGFVLPSSSLLARAMKSHATMACGGCRRRRLHVLLHGCGEQTEPRAEGCERRGFLKARLSRCHMLAGASRPVCACVCVCGASIPFPQGNSPAAKNTGRQCSPPLVLISVSTFVLSWFVVTFCNEFFCSNLAAMLLAMVF